MKVGLLVLCAAGALLAAGSGGASEKMLQLTLNGRCSATDELDRNGALVATRVTCSATGTCRCSGTTKLTYRTASKEPGNGNAGRESGSIVASSPSGTVTLAFKGSRTATGEAKGTWTLGKIKGFAGTKLTRRGTYSVVTKTLSSVVGTKDTLVRLTATLSPWLSGT
jgi:hypothetical protein